MVIDSDTYSSEEFYGKLVSLEFTDEEILKLYQREADTIGIDFKLPKTLANKFGLEYVKSNKNSEISLRANYGDTRKYGTLDINFNKIATYLGWRGAGSGATWMAANITQAEFLKGLVATSGFGWASALAGVAGALFSSLSKRANGATITFYQRYVKDPYDGDRWVIYAENIVYW